MRTLRRLAVRLAGLHPRRMLRSWPMTSTLLVLVVLALMAAHMSQPSQVSGGSSAQSQAAPMSLLEKNGRGMQVAKGEGIVFERDDDAERHVVDAQLVPHGVNAGQVRPLRNKASRRTSTAKEGIHGPAYERGAQLAFAEYAQSDMDERALHDASFAKHSFDEYASSKLPLDRFVPDIRSQQCRDSVWPTPEDLPPTSIIMCFIDEAWSTLLRSVWSVIKNSPSELIADIILVDDQSTKPWLRQPLDDYVAIHWPEIVKVVRAPSRLGLMKARLLGVQHAKGEVITFLDSHIECTKGWLEPLLQPLVQNQKQAVVPSIDAILDNNMEFQTNVPIIPAVGTFDWTLEFNWMSPASPGDGVEPIVSPTMAGGLFSMYKSAFFELGGYDEAMSGWGGENIEMSFRLWMCGGAIVSAPCSHVGHIFKTTHSYTIPNATIYSTFIRNSARLAEVWMDEYRDLFYMLQPAAKQADVGDVSERRALRQRLQCKTFQWYLDTVLPGKFVPDQHHVVFHGPVASALENTGSTRSPGDMIGMENGETWSRQHVHSFCLDRIDVNSGTVGLYPCHGLPGSGQDWIMSRDGQIRLHDDHCLTVFLGELTDQEVDAHYQNRGVSEAGLLQPLNRGHGLEVFAQPCEPMTVDGETSGSLEQDPLGRRVQSRRQTPIDAIKQNPIDGMENLPSVDALSPHQAAQVWMYDRDEGLLRSAFNLQCLQYVASDVGGPSSQPSSYLVRLLPCVEDVVEFGDRQGKDEPTDFEIAADAAQRWSWNMRQPLHIGRHK